MGLLASLAVSYLCILKHFRWWEMSGKAKEWEIFFQIQSTGKKRKSRGSTDDEICVKDIEIFMLLFNHSCPSHTPHVFIFLRCVKIPDGTGVYKVTMVGQA